MVFDLLAVCLKLGPRGQLKGFGEERQRYSVHVDGSHGGAQWGPGGPCGAQWGPLACQHATSALGDRGHFPGGRILETLATNPKE